MHDNALTKEEWKILFDKTSDKNYSKEEQIERYRKLVALKKKYRANPFKKGKILINNGVEEKFILADLPIPDGWVRGAKK